MREGSAASSKDAPAATARSTLPKKEEKGVDRLEVPPSMLRQHFFLHHATEVGDRLKEEHGLGGSWAVQTKRAKR